MTGLWKNLISLGLFILATKAAAHNDDDYDHPTHDSDQGDYDPTYTSKVTVLCTTTIIVPTTVEETHYVDISVPHYVNYTISNTETSIIETFITNSITDTLYFTVSVTETDSVTTTTSTTETVFSTTYDPCPTTCSVSVGTVNLFFWPSDRPYSYPTTYVDTDLGYTFTSPSVYMLIPTAQGLNDSGPTGPATSQWILPLDLSEVSTIFEGTLTRQLSLSDLGTNCPQTAEPSAIATMTDPRCDPILAAPRQVSSWAYPCNACGRFGLFDPPYAVPTLPGDLVDTTTTTATTPTIPTSTVTPTTETTATIPTSTGAPTPVPTTTISDPTTSSPPAPSSTSSIPTASATVVKGGFGWVMPMILAIVMLL